MFIYVQDAWDLVALTKDVMNTRGGGDNGKLESKMAVFK